MVVTAATCVIQALGDCTTLQFLYFYAMPMLHPCYVCAVPKLLDIAQILTPLLYNAGFPLVLETCLG